MKVSTLFAFLLLFVVTITSGIVHGRLSRRWGVSEELRVAGTKLEVFPTKFGNWEMVTSSGLGEYAERILECAGYVNRVYLNSETGTRVAVALLVGPAGPIATHSPEVCYSSRDFRVLDERKPVTLDVKGEPATAKLWGLTFESKDQSGDLLRVYYGWNDGSGWSAPRDARLSYLGRPYLYKIQAAAKIAADTNLQVDDPCRRFLDEFLVAARPCMWMHSEK